MPEHNSAIRATAAEKPLVHRMPGDTGRLLFVSPKRLHFLTQIPQVEKF